MSTNNAIRTIADRARTLHHEGINGRRPIGDFAEYLCQVKTSLTEAIGTNEANIDDNIEIATLQVADDLLTELSNHNLPREGREFIKSYGMQLLYEKLKRSGRLEAYVQRMNSFKLQRRNEVIQRVERYDGGRREGIGLFQTSIRDVILAPHAERVRRIEDGIFWSRVPEQIRVWLGESSSITSPARDESLTGEVALPDAVATSPVNDSSPAGEVIDVDSTGRTVNSFIRGDRTKTNTKKSYTTQINRFDRWLLKNNAKKSSELNFVEVNNEGNLFVPQPIMNFIRSYFYDLCSQVRAKSRQEFPFGERSARATVQALQWLFREEIRTRFNLHDEDSFKGLVWRQSIVKEFLCVVKERSDRLVQFETANGSLEVNLDFRDIHGDLHEDLSVQMMTDVLFSFFCTVKRRGVLRLSNDSHKSLVFSFLFTWSLGTGTRGESGRNLRLASSFVRERVSLGPSNVPMIMFGKIMNGGKMSGKSRLNITGCIPSVNPLYDSAAWEASILLNRIFVLKEDLDLCDPKTLLTRYLCCATRNKVKPISYDDHLDGFKRAFRLSNVVINSWITHLLRGQSRRILHEVGMHRDAILQQGGQLHDTLEDNYLQGPNNEALVILAGGLDEDPSSFVPCRYVALYNEFPSIESRNELVYSFCPIFRKVSVPFRILYSTTFEVMFSEFFFHKV